jgi:hypothetical protein
MVLKLKKKLHRIYDLGPYTPDSLALALWSGNLQFYKICVLVFSIPLILMFWVLTGMAWVHLLINEITAWLIT